MIYINVTQNHICNNLEHIMAHNQSSHPNKNHDNLLSVLKKIRDYKKSTEEGYTSLSDVTVPKMPDLDEAIRLIAPIQRTLSDHIILVHEARDIMREYLKMKSFILDNYVVNIAHHAGLHDTASQQKMRANIEGEMEENLKNLTVLSARLANEVNSALDKDLAYNELNSLIHDLSYRVHSYRPHYQSYLADNDRHCEVMYALN